MNPATHGAPLRMALLGNPNCGKTALFNLLTGSRQKVANYAGVTVERKEGSLRTPQGRTVRVLDLPGAYSLHAMSADEAITRDVVLGRRSDEPAPELLVCVTDATNLRLNLRLVLETRRLGRPMVMVLNMSDMAERRGIRIDRERLSQELGIPVVETVGVRSDGALPLLQALDRLDWAALSAPGQGKPADLQIREPQIDRAEVADVLATQAEVRRILSVVIAPDAHNPLGFTDQIDRVVLHPLWGLPLLAVVLFLMFQAVFSWAEWPMELIKSGVEGVGTWVQARMADGVLRSLIVDGVIAGAGSVLVFLPQILILFLFILALEDSGYLPRAAFLLDRMMGSVGLSGRSFIPLLSSFACAIPGVMATRTITHWRDRIVTIMIAPLMTCSARLPVYALLIGAFIPARQVAGGFNLQGLVLFALYVGGVVSAMLVAWAFKRLRGDRQPSPLLMELPAYRWPGVRNLVIGLHDRARIFLRRVGTIILSLMIVLWFLSSFPGAPEGAAHPPIYYSVAGMLGRGLEVLFAPIGFNWQISIALVPGLAAREVAVGALGTVYALSGGDDAALQLAPLIAAQWSMATALSLLVWYVFAPQCISTLVTVRRETGSWRYAGAMAAYLFALAYAASFITYRVAVWLGA